MISFFKSTSFNTPIPLHFLQAPLGELNEKLFGSGNSYEIPDSSHIRFKLKYLEDLLLVDISGKDPEVELEYTQENAELLVENSSEFDNWLNEVVFDLENFRSDKQGTDTEETDAVS